MQWEAAELFTTPVIKVRMANMDVLTQFFHETVKVRADVRDEQGGLSHYYSQSNVLLQYPELSDLKAKIEKTGTFVYQDLLNFKESGNLHTTNAWFNLCEIGASQSAHNHTNSLLCGTLYLTADENSELRFYHPQNNASYHAELFDNPSSSANKHGLRFHRREAKIPVRSGDCLFWPSWLKHGYQNNQTPDRLSLSFNMMPSKLNVDYQPFI